MAVPTLLAGCGGDRVPVALPAPHDRLDEVGVVADDPAWGIPSRPRRHRDFACDPGGGFPRPSATCPAGEAVTGWVVGLAGRAVTVRLFQTYLVDTEGRDYAAAHGLEFPFANDHYDASLGERRTYAVHPSTVCTGIIAVGSRSRLADHRVACGAFRRALDSRVAIPAAAWLDGDRLVQLSELYRP